jgi:hypothetical protein
MARPEATGRKAGARARNKARRVRKDPACGKTPDQFCDTWGISRSTWNNWQKRRTGPAVTQPAGPRGRQIITPEAEAEWARQYTKRPEDTALTSETA